ncbi:hypothetical protein Kpho02_70940 [Kitasatospora phosalacinea]|uniref:Uncharacterized protein n=1 Tax=Kitasatospora phosalacinea TaxID=2065 RepID=A0A9W6QDH9_9ACTN|nr:hypothetical protein Kpho02_70940 [Kitasatospora phosalacinea]
MACARCDFYTPEESTRSQLLEAKTNLQKMSVAIPLTDDEQAAVEDGQAALDRLLNGSPTSPLLAQHPATSESRQRRPCCPSWR